MLARHICSPWLRHFAGRVEQEGRVLTTERHRYLRYLEFGATEEAEFYFKHGFDDIRSAIKDLMAASELPQLKITSTHTDFKQGQTGATYTLTVSNAEDAGLTKSTIKVTRSCRRDWNCVHGWAEMEMPGAHVREERFSGGWAEL